MIPQLAALEIFSRAVATLKAVKVEVDIAELAALYDVPRPGNDDEDEEDDAAGEKPSTEVLAAAHRLRELEAATRDRL